MRMGQGQGSVYKSVPQLLRDDVGRRHLHAPANIVQIAVVMYDAPYKRVSFFRS